MAQTLPASSAPRLAGYGAAIAKLLDSKASMPAAAAVLLAVLLLFAYEVYGYLNAECHAALHAASLDRETAVLFDETASVIGGLRKGTVTAPKWNNPEFQGKLREAQSVLAGGRRALKEHDAFGALGSIMELEKSMVQAKTLATERVNFILAHQDPADYDTYEKYRLEGKDLVAAVKALDSGLETLDSRTKRLPKACNW